MRRLYIRYILALIVAFSSNFFYTIFSPLTIYTTYFILSLFYNVTMTNSSIIFQDVTFSFIPACTAATAYLIITELILLTRGVSFKNILKFLYISYLSIFTMNILRILVLIYIYLNYGKNYFDAFHLVFWHILSTIFVALVWIFLVEHFNIRGVPIYSDIKHLLKLKK
ncbi:pacearchaeosortase [archaeon]|jgi:exosortase/archaeosortase family protein|nr:pacearchaeosortase [archaeon]MBT3731307.1 pacearchaeosortase [archaeon]MBT4669960.1 pacearchaeosortase [archaeon]MBT5029785.1 pacearchaeosortase [archaeon]MBT5287466.1 pacearchaeosortase [archaeon]